MNGSGTPVTGHVDVTTPMLMKACTAIAVVMPTARKKPPRSRTARFECASALKPAE